jgi:hypothetical protein
VIRPFLTDLDSRAAIKGSRDPLGIQGLWTGLGRHVVGNLTTVSTSVRDFTTLLLGYWFAERVAERNGSGTELATFLKWEQLAAYARGHTNNDWGFRGTERVKGRLGESLRVTLSAGQDEQILSNQKIYGLWGLYSVPAQSSGLLQGFPAQLSPQTREWVERVYIAEFTRGGLRDCRAIVDLLAEERATFDFRGNRHQRDIGELVGKILHPRLLPMEREFYRQHLVCGGPSDKTEGRQAQLAELYTPHYAQGSFPWTPSSIKSLSREAVKRGTAWNGLAWRLDRIAIAESVLAPAAFLFSYLLGCNGATSPEVAVRIRNAWGRNGVASVDARAFQQLESELSHGTAEVGRPWSAVAASLANGDYEALIRLLVEQNRHVMQVRGNAGAWIEEDGGKFVVHMLDERGQLTANDELPDLWRHSYFVNSLYAVGSALQVSTDE